jgi:hypothetical protein
LPVVGLQHWVLKAVPSSNMKQWMILLNIWSKKAALDLLLVLILDYDVEKRTNLIGFSDHLCDNCTFDFADRQLFDFANRQLDHSRVYVIAANIVNTTLD